MKRFNPYLENKYLVSQIERYKFISSLNRFLVFDKHGQCGRYLVSSIYFDTDALDFYQDKLEGEFTKIKIRIRRYSADNGKSWQGYKLEAKMKRGSASIKLFNPISESEALKLRLRGITGREVLKAFNYSPFILHNQFNNSRLNETCEIQYKRQAFVFYLSSSCRITFDSHITCQAPSLNSPLIWLSQPKTILELKSNLAIPMLFQNKLKNMNIEQEHVSKYSSAIERVFKLA